MPDVSIVAGAFLLAASSMSTRTVSLTRGLIVVLVALSVTQVWREGLYWQFLPVVALIVLAMLSTTSAVASHRILRLAGRALTTLALLLQIACWIFLPVPVLPMPTGRYAVGTSIVRWTMPDRAEPATITDADRRSIIVQVWYPAEVSPDKPHSTYIDGLGHLPARVAGLPRAILQHYDGIDTHAVLNAAVNTDVVRWPVVIFSPGYGASRAFYTSLLGDLASRGIIVLAVDHPFESAITQLADGRIVTPDDRWHTIRFDPRPVARATISTDRERSCRDEAWPAISRWACAPAQPRARANAPLPDHSRQPLQLLRCAAVAVVTVEVGGVADRRRIAWRAGDREAHE